MQQSSKRQQQNRSKATEQQNSNRDVTEQQQSKRIATEQQQNRKKSNITPTEPENSNSKRQSSRAATAAGKLQPPPM